jgi:TetR/AcrR family transcriptional regulator, regulator of autoinduction and epiphytic fitness
VRTHLDLERDSGHLDLTDIHLVANQFLGMIADCIFWPRLLVVDFTMEEALMHLTVDEAVLTFLARYRRVGDN